MKKYILNLNLLLFTILGFSQEITTYNMANSGLSSDRVTDFLTINNNIWFGEAHGTSLFNGSTFQNFDFIQMGSNNAWLNVSGSVEDRNGNIWFASDYGIFRYDGTNWTHYGSSNESNLGYGSIFVDIIMDNNGILWILGGDVVDSYLYSLDTSNFTWNHYDKYSNPLFGQAIWKLAIAASNGNLIMASDDGFVEFDGTTFTSHQAESTFGFDMDPNGNYWSGDYSGSHGLYKYNTSFNEISSYDTTN